MLWLTMGLTVDGQPLNLTILTLPKRHLRKLPNKVRNVTKISFNIENTLYVSFASAFFEVWHQILLVLEQQSETPRISI